MADRSTADMTREELERLVGGLDFLLAQVREKGGELLVRWNELDDAARLENLRRALSPTLINPWPLDDLALAGLRSLAPGPEVERG